MTPEDAEEYTASLGQIMGGAWRQIAWADRQDIPAALGLTTEEWVQQRLGGYVRLSIEERREAVGELAAEGMKQHEIAAVLGVDQATVSRDANASASNGDQDDCEPDDADASDDEPPPLEESMAKLDQTAMFRDILNEEREEREAAERESSVELSELRDACRRLLGVLVIIDHLPADERAEATDWLGQLRQEMDRHA